MTYRDWDDPMTVLAEAVTARGFGRATIGTDHYAFDMPVARFASRGAPQRTLCRYRPYRVGAAANQVAGRDRAAAPRGRYRRCRDRGHGSSVICLPGATQRDAVTTAINSSLANGADPGPAGPITAGQG